MQQYMRLKFSVIFPQSGRKIYEKEFCFCDWIKTIFTSSFLVEMHYLTLTHYYLLK
jgi:hypothetical protein